MQFPQFLAVFAQLPQILFNSTPSAASSSASSVIISTDASSIIPQETFSSVDPLLNTAAMSSEKQITFEQKKYTLPSLPYAYDALEPFISKTIMELHHTKHHQAYVNNLNAALLNHVTALQKGDVKQQIEIQQMIKFNGGGHINHSLFWTNLTPAGTPAASPSSAPKLSAAINKRWGSHEGFTDAFGKTLMGIQGSGWGWLVKDSGSGELEIVTTKDQDPVVGGQVPIVGVDMWEHAYYIQYYNDKASYVKGIWNIINWSTAEKRYNGDAIGTKL